MPSPFRYRLVRPTEPALNVLLAEQLARKGLRAFGEGVIVHKGGVSKPDVWMTVEGVPVILEGRFEGPGVEESLARDCRRRLEEDLCWISVALVYPPLPSRVVQGYSHEEAKRYLQESRYKVRVLAISSAGVREGSWQEGVSFSDLAALLRQVHQEVVSEDRLAPAVEALRDGLANFTSSLGMSADLTALAERLRQAMGLPEGKPAKEKGEDEEE